MSTLPETLRTLRSTRPSRRADPGASPSEISELTEPETDWLERVVVQPGDEAENAEAARQLVDKILSRLSPPARMVITLLEIEDRTVKEIAVLTGWSVALVKVRAFRARAEMRKILKSITKEKYL